MSDDWKEAIKKAQHYMCACCGRQFKSRDLTIHHKKAKCNGGRNSEENCVAFCRTCHQNYHKQNGTRESDGLGRPKRR